LGENYGIRFAVYERGIVLNVNNDIPALSNQLSIDATIDELTLFDIGVNFEIESDEVINSSTPKDDPIQPNSVDDPETEADESGYKRFTKGQMLTVTQKSGSLITVDRPISLPYKVNNTELEY